MKTLALAALLLAAAQPTPAESPHPVIGFACEKGVCTIPEADVDRLIDNYQRAVAAARRCQRGLKDA